MIPVKILGTGLYAPGKPIGNPELKKLAGIEFDESKLEEKLGIGARHIAHLRGLDETTADFATRAARNAIKEAGIDPLQAGLFIVATDTPEYITPATAIIVQGRIQGGERWAAAFDISSSCAGFAMAFDAAAAMLNTNPAIKYAVVAGVYNMPAFLRPGDAFGYTIFADGAGAFVLGRDENGGSGYIGGQMLADGTQWDYIGVYAGGTRKPVTAELLEKDEYGLQNLKPLPGDRNVRLWPMVVQKILATHGMTPDGVDHYIFTQINRSVIVKVMEEIGQPPEKALFIMDRYGYTGSGCLPMSMHEGIRSGRIKRGDTVLMVASGAGLSVGANLFVY